MDRKYEIYCDVDMLTHKEIWEAYMGKDMKVG